jgi:molybdopterin/thiamine biosynthesis adenylyltransferase
VFGPVPGVVGTMMAVEALKFAAGIAVQTGILNIYDAMASEWRKVKIRRRRNCPGCRAD